MNTRQMYGRRVIKTDVSMVTSKNICEVLTKAMGHHIANSADIQYLWDYYRGQQPILSRTKVVRPEICNKIVENRANEIVTFKVGYLCGEPIQYIGKNGDEAVSKGVSQLNEMMASENKDSKDTKLVEWQMIAGTGYRLVLPNDDVLEDNPFKVHTLDPRNTFVVYSTDVGNKPMLGVTYYTDDMGVRIYSVYSNSFFWKIKGDAIVEGRPHGLGMIPIFEYPANTARLGSFEIVLPLLDTLNNIASNRMDGIEQFVQSFIKFVNCDIDEEQFKALKELGAIKVKSTDGATASVDIITSSLDQSQTQVTKDDIHQAILSICGMPSVGNGQSDSSNNGAVILKNGWQGAETRAKNSELLFKESEREMLKLVLKICRDTVGTPDEVCSLRVTDIDPHFTRRNYENIQSKSQVLVSMLQQPKIHPRLAFEASGLFIDPEGAYAESMKYHEEQMPIVENESPALTDEENAEDANQND